MRVLVVGCGKVGAEIVRDLSSSKAISSVTAADANPASLARFKHWPKVETAKADLTRKKTLDRLIDQADLVCGALPGRIGFELLQRVVELSRDIVDISYTPKDPFQLHRLALRNRCTLVPQCGVAPGFTNMCVGDACRKLDKVTWVRIFVGGLPQKPVPPLNYKIVFSLDDLVNVYTRPVNVVENGHSKVVEPLSGRGLLSFPGVGKLEHFLTDGLGTLPRSFPEVPSMEEMTLRYPGHAEMINTLRVIGFFERRKFKVDHVQLEPRQLTLELLQSALSKGAPEDLLAFRVDVEGFSDGKNVLLRYQMLDRFDRKNGVSAMARTTAYPCTSVALLILQGRLAQKGVVTAERIAQDREMFNFVLAHLRKRGIRLTIQRKNR